YGRYGYYGGGTAGEIRRPAGYRAASSRPPRLQIRLVGRIAPGHTAGMGCYISWIQYLRSPGGGDSGPAVPARMPDLPHRLVGDRYYYCGIRRRYHAAKGKT